MIRMWHHPTRRLVLQIAADTIALSIAYIAAFYLRFNMAPATRYLEIAYRTLPIVILATLMGLLTLRVYRTMWRYLSLNDLARFAKALMLGVLLATVLLAFWMRLLQYPRTVLPIYATLAMVFLSSLRMIARSWFERGVRLRTETGSATRAILIGAGSATELLLRELRNNSETNLHVVGLLDDNPIKRGRLMQGTRVLGAIEDLPKFVKSEEIEQVVFCIPSAPNSLRLQVLESCSDLGVRLDTLPRIADLAEGKVTINQIREIALEDLLGRDAVALDEKSVANFINDKIIMVTGAGGSIGSEICRQVAKYGPATIVLFERSEYPLFQIEGELRRCHPSLAITPLLGDIQDAARVQEVLAHYQPELVFHAAAYKHVPLVEMNPFEAVANNIGGSLILAEACAKQKVDRFVLISTDKAVNPTSFMGVTKRIAERICQAVGSQTNITRFTTVRFGNVIGSSGSVIPTFKEQIRRGGPVTVTHKDVERFFMTIPEAAQLVLQASTLSEGDETFILEMGQPVKIAHLAKQMIRLSGLREGEDISIQFTGLRPGEKLYEELVLEGETHTQTSHKKILRVSRKEQDDRDLLNQVNMMLQANKQRDAKAIAQLATQLVDNYLPEKLHLTRLEQ